MWWDSRVQLEVYVLVLLQMLVRMIEDTFVFLLFIQRGLRIPHYSWVDYGGEHRVGMGNVLTIFSLGAISLSHQINPCRAL